MSTDKIQNLHKAGSSGFLYIPPNLRKKTQRAKGRRPSFPFIEEILPDDEDGDYVISVIPQPSVARSRTPVNQSKRRVSFSLAEDDTTEISQEEARFSRRQRMQTLSAFPGNIGGMSNISIRQARRLSMDSVFEEQGINTRSPIVQREHFVNGQYQLHVMREKDEPVADMVAECEMRETDLSNGERSHKDGSVNEDAKENKVNAITNKYVLAADLRGQYISSSSSDDEEGSDVNSHVNKLFQFDEDIEEQRNKNFFSFGKKGRGYGEFQDATGMTLFGKGKVVISDLINSRVQLCNKTGSVTMVYAADVISQPWCTALTKEGHIAITSRKTKCVVFISRDGEVLSSFGSNFFQCPSGIAVDSQGRIIVTDVTAETVSVHDKSGKLIKYLGDRTDSKQKFSKPRYVCVSVRGDIFVSDSGNHCVKMFDSNLEYVKSFGAFGSHDGQLKYPYGICTDSLGDILVADHYNNRISMFARDGTFTRQIVTKQNGLVHPQGIALSTDLNLYVTHGHLKASEIVVYKLCCQNQPTLDGNTECVISYV